MRLAVLAARRAAWALAISMSIAMSTSVPAPAQATRYEGRLSTVPIDPATQAQVTGEGRVMAALDGRRVEISGSFAGLQGPVTVARLHLGAYTGVRGAPIAELSVEGDRSGTISGAVELTQAQLQAMREGRLYVQLHSESAEEGNLWGWLLP